VRILSQAPELDPNNLDKFFSESARLNQVPSNEAAEEEDEEG